MTGHPPSSLRRTLGDMGRLRRRVIAASLLALGLVGLLPAVVGAHPLGNFTINHYAELTVAPSGIDLAIVIDMAEIPTFQERQAMDADGDGSISDDEAATGASTRCRDLVPSLHLGVAGSTATLTPGSASMTFPGGAGGLSTLRLECGYRAALATPIAVGSSLTFEDVSYQERIGWREIVASGSGATLDTGGLPATSPTQRLTAYPADQLSQPLDIQSARITVTGLTPAPSPAATTIPLGPTAAPATAAAAVPGGVAGELPDVFRSADLTPLVALLSLLTAVALGAFHAVTPGHGKTIMAAYLVGSRGTAIHAVGLGLSVTVSHTLGILVLALLVVGAQGILPPDVVVRTAPVIAAFSIVLIGAWMLVAEARRRLAARPLAGAHEHAHQHEGAGAGEHKHEVGHEHSHGGVRHSHLPAANRSLSWRGLFALGLAGGLTPSTSALLILLLSIEANRLAFGVVLVLAFGLGMAGVMTTVGLVLVFARTRLDRLPSASWAGSAAGLGPAIAAVVVFGLGLVLTAQAVGGNVTL
jgi:ABC-type nickel/cobalt efflux system permease component RcnA